MFNRKIKLALTKDNQHAKTESFPATDAGVKAFVSYINDHNIVDRISLNLAGSKITTRALIDLERLENLVFVQLPGSRQGDPAVERFRKARPDVELRPEKMQVVRTEICESISGFQTFIPKPERKIAPGESFQIYTELKGIRVNSRSFGEQNYNSVKIEVQLRDDRGRKLKGKVFPSLDNMSREYPRWFYRTVEFQLPDDTPTGSYSLILQITDELNAAKPTVTTSLPIVVSSSDSRQE